MRPDALAGVPAEPPGIAEWEELLVRVELAPRALRAALEEAGEHAAAVRERLVRVVQDEIRWGEMMNALRRGDPVPTRSADAPPLPSHVRAPDDLLRSATELRGRTSAQVQRRGLEVWRWRAPTSDGEPCSAYRLLTAMVRGDARHLAALRAVTRTAAVPCD